MGGRGWSWSSTTSLRKAWAWLANSSTEGSFFENPRRFFRRSSGSSVPCSAVIAVTMLRAVTSRRSVPDASRSAWFFSPMLARRTRTNVASALASASYRSWALLARARVDEVSEREGGGGGRWDGRGRIVGEELGAGRMFLRRLRHVTSSHTR